MLIDFHNHLIPGVDDGASTIEEAERGLTAMKEAGVGVVVATPHFRGSLTSRADEFAHRMAALDLGYEQLQSRLASVPGLRLERGVEVMLDNPDIDFSDPRVRLAGTRFVLIEFPLMMVPQYAAQAIFQIRNAGWRPIVAHPERYSNLEDGEPLEDLRSVGSYFQVNSGSILGKYGKTAQAHAWSLFEQGMVDFVSSDYHTRGRVTLKECREALIQRGGEEQSKLLMEDNGARLLRDEEPLTVPPLPPERKFWQKLVRR